MASKNDGLSRRDVIKTTGTVAAASALAGVILPQVHAGESNTIQLALVGCGGRGTGAAANALQSTGGPTRLVAMADVFTNRLESSHGNLQREFQRAVDVPQERRFIGFNAYRQAMDALRPGDVVILATPPAFRWVQFTYAIEKRLNVFMEKPITVDGPSTRRMLTLGEQAQRQNLKVAVGLMCRHCDARKELERRLRDGQLGEVNLMRAYRMAGPTATAFSRPRPANIPELHYQIQRFHSFLWASGGAYSDFLIHNIDECCWMKGASMGQESAWPINAKASGGRHYRGNYIDQNFDTYSVEYTFADGGKLFLEGRTMAGAHGEFASFAHGSRGSAVISISGHTPARCRISRTQNPTNMRDVTWRANREEPDPYQLEWNHLMDAIRNNRQYSEVARGAEASLITAMGRMAAHTGQVITRDQMFNCQHEFAPEVDRLTLDGPAPLRADENGRYPVPQPGILTTREY
jgi:predicted dehydrogenase